MEEYNLHPERDYAFNYSYGHAEPIRAVASGEVDAAPIASDILARTIGKGEVDGEALRVIYESERFPPVAFGFACNLAPNLQEGIREARLGLGWYSPGKRIWGRPIHQVRACELQGRLGQHPPGRPGRQFSACRSRYRTTIRGIVSIKC